MQLYSQTSSARGATLEDTSWALSFILTMQNNRSLFFNGEDYNNSLAAKVALAYTPANSKMADGVWKGAYHNIFGHSGQLSLNKFFWFKHSFYEKEGEWMMKIVATTSLPAADRPNADLPERSTLVPILLSGARLITELMRCLTVSWKGHCTFQF